MTPPLIDRIWNGRKTQDLAALEVHDLQAENNALNAKLSRMAVDLAQKRLELDRLRRAVRRSRPSYSWLAERAEMDAKGLYIMQCTGVQPSRRQAQDILNMSVRRWQWARALALMAGVHDGSLFYADVDPRDLIKKLADAAAYAETHPEVWRQFRAR